MNPNYPSPGDQQADEPYTYGEECGLTQLSYWRVIRPGRHSLLRVPGRAGTSGALLRYGSHLPWRYAVLRIRLVLSWGGDAFRRRCRVLADAAQGLLPHRPTAKFRHSARYHWWDGRSGLRSPLLVYHVSLGNLRLTFHEALRGFAALAYPRKRQRLVHLYFTATVHMEREVNRPLPLDGGELEWG